MEPTNPGVVYANDQTIIGPRPKFWIGAGKGVKRRAVLCLGGGISERKWAFYRWQMVVVFGEFGCHKLWEFGEN